MPPSSDFVLVSLQLFTALLELFAALMGLWAVMDGKDGDGSDDGPDKKS